MEPGKSRRSGSEAGRGNGLAWLGEGVGPVVDACGVVGGAFVWVCGVRAWVWGSSGAGAVWGRGAVGEGVVAGAGRLAWARDFGGQAVVLDVQGLGCGVRMAEGDPVSGTDDPQHLFQGVVGFLGVLQDAVCPGSVEQRALEGLGVVVVVLVLVVGLGVLGVCGPGGGVGVVWLCFVPFFGFSLGVLAEFVFLAGRVFVGWPSGGGRVVLLLLLVCWLLVVQLWWGGL